MAPVRSAASLAQPARLAGAARAVAADLLALLAHVPHWAAAPGGAVAAEEVTLRQLGGAMSNHIFRVESVRAGAVPLLLRLYGSLEGGDAALFSRDGEVATAEAVAALALGPRCFVLFANGRLEEYLDGLPLTAPAMRTPRVAAAVAGALARFHALATPRLGAPCALWTRLRAWHALAAAAAEAQPPGPRREALLRTLASVPAASDALRAALAPWAASGAPGSGTVFSHNDLQHNNVLSLGAGDPTSRKDFSAVSIATIDYEYALPAPAAYDIANHFCERAADYADGAEGGMLNYPARYPSADEREAFCAAYLEALGEPPGGGGGAAARALAAAADAHALASHLVWALWGVVQARASTVDFDFLGYADDRFAEYTRHAARLAAEGGAGPFAPLA